MANDIHSIHSLVRLLKAPTDPPFAPGPSKIEIAHLAWSNSSLHAPNKGEVIGEWILILLGQARKMRRGKDATSNPDVIADSRYWSLLSDVLSVQSTATTRPAKTWLLPLLNRLQLEVIIAELLSLHSPQVLAPARVALSVLWPLAEKKIGIDALAECLHLAFEVCAEWECVDENLCWICSAIVSAYRNGFINAGNKKKLNGSFLATYLSSWLCAVHSCSSIIGFPSLKQLQDDIYAAGSDTLFSLDALKQPLDALFDAFFSQSRALLLPALPKLFTSFLSAMHKHRSALFASATSVVGGRDELRKGGMNFAAKCWALATDSATTREDSEVEKWKAVIGILEIVAKERLFVPHSPSGHIEGEGDELGGEVALGDTRDKVIGILETAGRSPNSYQEEQIILSIRFLDVLVRVEYNFVGSVLGRIISAVINIPSPLHSSVKGTLSEFLMHVLDYHIKTRTVHTYALALLGAVTEGSSAFINWTPLPPSVSRSFPLSFHLQTLSYALRTSLTLTQIAPLATDVLRAVEDTWRTLEHVRPPEERVAKKRKVAEDKDKSDREERLNLARAVGFSYTCRVAGTILSNLPSNAYTHERDCSLEHLWSEVGRICWTVIRDSLREQIELGREHDMTEDRVSKKRKHAVEVGSHIILYPQIIPAASFRFLYDVRSRTSSLGDCDQIQEADIGSLLKVARNEASDAELVLETTRTLLWHVWFTHQRESEEQMDAQPIFAMINDIVTRRPESEPVWSGDSTALNRDNLPLAVMYVLMDRWIDILDQLASADILESLISILLSVRLDPTGKELTECFDNNHHQRDRIEITLRSILFNLLRSARFWELHNIRAVFLSSILGLTSPLSYHFTADTIKLPSSSLATESELVVACNTYRLLLYVPPDYFTRPARTELVKRAIAGDVQICKMLECGNRHNSQENVEVIRMNDSVSAEDSKSWSHRLTFVRLFLQRMMEFLPVHSHVTSSAFVGHLLSSPLCMPSSSEVLIGVTLDLIQSHIVNLLRSRDTDDSVCNIISMLATIRPFSERVFQGTWAQAIAQSAALKFIGYLTSNFDPASLSDQVKQSLKTLTRALESTLLPHVQQVLESRITMPDQILPSQLIDAWSHMTSLTRWLGMNPQVAPIPLGLRLATLTLRTNNATGPDSKTCSSILTLLFEELWCMPDVSHRIHLDVLVSFYVVKGDTEVDAMDACIAQAAKRLSVQDFSQLVDILAEAMEGGGIKMGTYERLIRLGGLVLHDAPQGTLKVIQTFATRCFNLFADREEIYGRSTHLKLHCLEFIARHCSDRPAAIRSVDLGSIWSFLHKTLSGSSKHDATTDSLVFHHIITIIGALVRLRRDLVVHTLPHLSLVLCRLMMLTRRIRPQLGAKQSKIVTDSFPSWLSASQPLSSDDARALARLLTSLATKTVPRTHAHAPSASTSTESPKAESLAKPFAKHASYVLVAYVDAFNDPLCIMDAETRRELEPGLFALCEMVGEHSRDALMLSALDSGGKTIMKSLWREYEKQRYVGKG